MIELIYLRNWTSISAVAFSDNIPNSYFLPTSISFPGIGVSALKLPLQIEKRKQQLGKLQSRIKISTNTKLDHTQKHNQKHSNKERSKAKTKSKRPSTGDRVTEKDTSSSDLSKPK